MIMSTKDWILLIIPLVGNGIIFFVLQQLILNHYKRKQEKLAYQDRVIEKFMAHLEDFLSTFHGLRKAYVDPFDRVPFSSVWNPTSEKMQYLVNYYERNQVVLEKIRPTFQLICDQWDEMVNLVAEYKLAERTMDPEFINNFNSKCINLHGLIKQCLLESEKQFLRV